VSPSARTVLLGGAVLAGAAAARRRAAAAGVAAAPSALPAPPTGRPRSVRTADDVELSVVEHGAGDGASATVVLAHGYVQSSALWHGQVRDLVDGRPDLRVVTYDHRGHGRSGRTSRDGATLEQLARDLLAVLDAVAPDGPVVLAGHSMGGMTIMALAEEHPELFGDRIAAAAFVATSSGGLDAVTWGLPAPVARALKRLLPVLTEQAVKAERRGRARPVGRFDSRLVFPRGVDRALVQSVLDVHRSCSAETVAAFLPTFSAHDRLQVLASLSHVPSLVVVGDQDLLCPLEHSRAIADALPQSELVVFPGVGHMVHLERRAEVSRSLLALVDRALAGRRAAGAA
jgi:pimeloyl-ACP methyl ester carboxylesterase